ncbi:hypothetical protein [Escherichia coli]|nr:hypothetical protein [Escherichia coli]MCA7297620.1 hypothetical protein [Escherichia coli]MCA8581236.1 hypothetical protein [Escherichia coli]MCA8743332.1 hypothetical protein [Escherichia coli]MCA8785453.1 hypothetical protein [Escherichia coli]MCA8814120.1 hypothetical protein [Escherichia coli]
MRVLPYRNLFPTERVGAAGEQAVFVIPDYGVPTAYEYDDPSLEMLPI